jgi:copper chaperone
MSLCSRIFLKAGNSQHTLGVIVGEEQSEGVAMSTVIVDVQGMTCQHCVNAVTSEVEGIPGVTEVSIALEPEGTSQVTVVAESDVSADSLQAAIEEAGYEMVGVQSS